MSFSVPGTKLDYANTAATTIQRYFESMAEYQTIWKQHANKTTKSMEKVIEFYKKSLAEAKLSMQTIRDGDHPDTIVLGYRLGLYETQLTSMQEEFANHIQRRKNTSKKRKPTTPSTPTPDDASTSKAAGQSAPSIEPPSVSNEDEDCSKRLKAYAEIEPVPMQRQEIKTETFITQSTVEADDESDSSGVAIEMNEMHRPEDVAKQLAAEERRRRLWILAIVVSAIVLFGVIVTLLYLLWKRK